MAKATYQCAKCAKLVEVVARNRSEADRLAAHRDGGGLCHACWASERDAERAAESAAAAANAGAAGLPALTGSEKQIAWANTLRGKLLEQLDALLAAVHVRAAAAADVPAAAQQLQQIEVGAELIRARTEASWWIDQRATDPRSILRGMLAEIDAEIARRAALPATPVEAAEEQAAQEEALLKPSAPVSPQVADISQPLATEIRVSFPQRLDAVRDAMHALGYKWSATHWAKALSFRTGDPIDRMAEAASALLAAGVMVRLHHAAARDKAVAGSYTPEQRRWISQATAGQYAGWYVISWPKSDDLYAPARKLLGSRYADGGVYMPPGSTDEVLDFAAHYDFALSPGAQEVAAKRQAEMARGVVVDRPKAAVQTSVREADTGRPAPLSAPTDAEVDDELRDPE